MNLLLSFMETKKVLDEEECHIHPSMQASGISSCWVRRASDILLGKPAEG